MNVKMSRAEMQVSLRAERLSATQQILTLRREIVARQHEIDTLEARLESINQAEGLL